MIRLIKSRKIELSTFIFAALIFSLSLLKLTTGQSLLVSFSLSSILYMGLVLAALVPLDHEALSKKVSSFDHGHLTVMALAWAAIFGVFAAICGLLMGSQSATLEIILSISAITVAWIMLHFIDAIHYTHIQYGGDGPDKRGLTFPCNTPGIFIDMLYFSFTVGMTFATSDVEVITPQMRVVVMIHAVASFLFNLFIFAIAVASIGSLLGFQ